MAEENEQGTHLDVPDFLQYSHDHVWVDESVTPAVLGITEFAANSETEDDGAVINDDPYGEGWIVKIELDDDEPDLLSAGEYAKFIAQQQ